MSGPLETFVKENRQGLDTAKPDPAIWEEISERTNKQAKFSLLKLWKKIKTRLGDRLKKYEVRSTKYD